MRYRRHWFGPLAALLVIVLLFGIGSAISRNAWSQGYMMGQLAAGSESGAMMPYPPYYASHGPGGLGLLFGGVLVFFLIAFVGKTFLHRSWRMPHGPWSEKWAEVSDEDRQEWEKWWREHRAQMPPWWQAHCHAKPNKGEQAETDDDLEDKI